jgi:hypothetical protein
LPAPYCIPYQVIFLYYLLACGRRGGRYNTGRVHGHVYIYRNILFPEIKYLKRVEKKGKNVKEYEEKAQIKRKWRENGEKMASKRVGY